MPDLSHVHALADSQHGVVSRAQAVECGLSAGQIDRLIRRHEWRRLRTGVYLVRRDPAPPALAARVMAAQLIHGPRAVAVGPTAARLWRLQGLLRGPGYEYVHLTVADRGASASTGLRLYGWNVEPGEVTLRKGIRLTTPARTLRDTVLLTDRDSAVSVIDSALAQGLVDPGDLPALAAANTGRVGAPRSRPWWDLAAFGAESTLETRLRLICHDAGIPPEALQYPVHDSTGTVVGHADLAWPSWGVVAEADGHGPHSLPGALYTDRHRQNSIVTTPDHLTLLRFTWSDLHHPREIVAMILEARNNRTA
ncbi:type IV toxin-antitoxin system AbiEi family antitoxin domain-containing protein [Nocardiopsis sediminis]|uniref:Type IV toxin-antitoxin system AbiEi family antitoxin domain-containing protein n=1 Tax=Nocardiopsis sediminis TaxID=1778267 RepID=A0ABV8FIL3_9ACTN